MNDLATLLALLQGGGANSQAAANPQNYLQYLLPTPQTPSYQAGGGSGGQTSTLGKALGGALGMGGSSLSGGLGGAALAAM